MLSGLDVVSMSCRACGMERRLVKLGR